MKDVFLGTTLSLLILMTISACDTCEGLESDPVGGEFFSITYQDADGRNLLRDVWRQANVQVFIDSSGGQADQPDFFRIEDDFSDGRFGPFAWTEPFTDSRTLDVNTISFVNEEQQYDYYVKKDTFGVDTIRLKYLLIEDECRTFWETIEISVNGEVKSTGAQQVDIVIVE